MLQLTRKRERDWDYVPWDPCSLCRNVIAYVGCFFPIFECCCRPLSSYATASPHIKHMLPNHAISSVQQPLLHAASLSECGPAKPANLVWGSRSAHSSGASWPARHQLPVMPCVFYYLPSWNKSDNPDSDCSLDVRREALKSNEQPFYSSSPRLQSHTCLHHRRCTHHKDASRNTSFWACRLGNSKRILHHRWHSSHCWRKTRTSSLRIRSSRIRRIFPLVPHRIRHKGEGPLLDGMDWVLLDTMLDTWAISNDRIGPNTYSCILLFCLFFKIIRDDHLGWIYYIWAKQKQHIYIIHK